MNVGEQVRSVLDETLNLEGRSAAWSDDTALLGSVPELSSLAVVTVLVALEERFGIVIEDDELTGEVFTSVGSLIQFISGKLGNGRVAVTAG